MKITALGAENYINQIQRIRDGLEEVSSSIASEYRLIYCNDPSVYDSSFIGESNTKVIYNVLDLPPHLMSGERYDLSRYPYINHRWRRDFQPNELASKLAHCHAVTCICDEVKWQLKNWCKIDATTIYNPIKDVSHLDLSEDRKIRNPKGKPYKYLYVGRANDINKRFHIVRETMCQLGESPDLLAVVGSENPGWGDYYGVISDEHLEIFYNSVQFLFFPSAFKSIGLPALEAVVTKCIPIVCEDDPTTAEFFNEIGVSPDPRIIAQTINNEEWLKNARHFVEKNSHLYHNKFNKIQIARNILSVFNSL